MPPSSDGAAHWIPIDELVLDYFAKFVGADGTIAAIMALDCSEVGPSPTAF